MPRKRRVCFVTGTRAEFGLMQSVLKAIAQHPKLQLQIAVTGMHLDRRHGRTVDSIDWKIDATVPWRGKNLARDTGLAVAGLANAFDRLRSQIVLIVGDRVEAFAAAAAGHIGGRIVAHIHGGDRALGQIDDSLRHSITKLAHVHFPATTQSAQRLRRLGEDRWRIFTAGAPGIDGIRQLAISSDLPKYRFALVILHPTDANESAELRRAKLLLGAVQKIPFERIVIVHPNNDSGSRGIARCWDKLARGEHFIVHRNIDRPHFLGLLRDAAMLVGNSSSGIIEAASFGTPVIDIGPRQLGRERSQNVTHVPNGKTALQAALKRLWNRANPHRFTSRNVYGGNGAGRKIAHVLSSIEVNRRLREKLIAY